MFIYKEYPLTISNYNNLLHLEAEHLSDVALKLPPKGFNVVPPSIIPQKKKIMTIVLKKNKVISRRPVKIGKWKVAS